MILIHKYLLFNAGYVTMTSDEWKKLMETIYNHRDTRIVQFFEKESAIIVRYLKSYGIYENSEEGDRAGEFEVLGNYPEDILCQRDASTFASRIAGYQFA
ncbi:hypothetical protein PENTCL1PPCAC_13300 [Pristionchus entomophagus]|uniref:Uncharacterized protein n=1 Tax=Pristionchus entomophagus TaxID=358040 RepID=A0AAV5TEK4_9BILA|nr:hypothetical protein PENTCL1PPCAC_13300 [Pristionchus entomophagus]